MRDIATAALSGNLTREVEIRELPSGGTLARLRVATTTRWRSGEGWTEKTKYFTVEVYGAQALTCAQYLTKGSRVVIDAELDWREWIDAQSNRREAVTLRARQVLFEAPRPTSTVDRREVDASPETSESVPPLAAATAREPDGALDADDLPF